VTLRWGRLRYLAVLGPAALAATVGLAACSHAAAPSGAASADPGAGSEHSLTLAQARAAYDAWVTASMADAKQGLAVQGLNIVADAQWSIDHAQYAAAHSTGTPVTQYRYGTPAFYVPALSSYPQWFVVDVPASPQTGSQAGPAVSTLMVFVHTSKTAPWTVDGSAALDQPLPSLARDSAGYAVSVGSTDQNLLVPPDLVGPTQAAVVDQGPAAPAAAILDSGPLTTALYSAQAALGTTATKAGLFYQWLLEGASFAQWELKTADGGALVLYAMYLNTTTEHPGAAAGSPIPVPAGFTPLLTTPNEVALHEVTANWTYEFAAIDPPQSAHGAKITVIGGTGSPTYGSAH
jgi:hypothetical protein